MTHYGVDCCSRDTSTYWTAFRMFGLAFGKVRAAYPGIRLLVPENGLSRTHHRPHRRRPGAGAPGPRHLWEENDSGEVCTWGRVLTWDPPRTFAFTWLLGPDWQPPAADAAGSRVTVTFTPVDGGTRVDLVHDRLEAHGPGWERVRDAVAGDGGWPGLLRQYAATV
ncbi:activator of Hsp90 ATPase-like protein [Micromonospora kangleipakensis]|uniref:Activator of Hsp90 ATPase-like protein n=1 Tax=Micromonospora kangleipakensis TaxID=1077942 RepID=A0A4Q8B9S8_9ACTN|nr:SRPBCC domain-containing protein [Micromonospora kangleipakensis]RZU74500.1 activator of Hsp90 ATPase-like protein [Micromonospora kangleipakensis]